MLEGALAAEHDDPDAVIDFTIQVPLGETEAGTVFLVREDAPSRRLLRLKRWRTQRTDAFVERFTELKAQLEQWRQPAIVLPVAAWIDGAGRASALTEFRQGLPLLDSVRSGSLSGDLALAGLRRLREILGEAHARGLAHGSLVAGNVFTGRPDRAPYLLDFGFRPLFFPLAPLSIAAESDLDELAQLEAATQALASSTSSGL